MKFDRFAFDTNLQRATHYRDWRGAFWPPSGEYHVFCMDIVSRVPPELCDKLDFLQSLIDAEWANWKIYSHSRHAPMKGAGEIAARLAWIAEQMPNPDDRRALHIRAAALERGYTEEGLRALAEIEENMTLVAGKISTWYGKEIGGVPTAFGCVRDADANSAVAAVMTRLPEAEAYVRRLHSQLRLAKLPSFTATQLFFMAGEGNRHPKHIAYFLPEDEGVKRSPFKKTYYFVNTHRAMLDRISLRLAEQMLDLGRPIPMDAGALEPIPTLGVLAHEIGHAVHREELCYTALNNENRWASVVLQEMAADVFGVLLLAEVFAPAMSIAAHDVVLYHLAECLRYVNRGLGCFPDSDGMYLQLNYLAAFGALNIETGAQRVLKADPDVIIAGFRSLARVLADTLLNSDTRRALSLYEVYGPASNTLLAPLVGELRQHAQISIEYIQDSGGRHSNQPMEMGV